MGNQRIVASASIDPIAIDILEKIAPVEISPAPDEETLMALMENTIAIVNRGGSNVTARMIEACAPLRVIGRSGAGYDSVDIAAATKRRIPVVYAPVNAFAVAEGALAMLLALVKRIPECDAMVKTGHWSERYGFKTGDMTAHTLGIVGLGRIGSHLAKLMQPFEMTVLACDPYASVDAAEELGVELVALDALLKRSDYVSLHVLLTDETRGLINERRVATMKKGAILINTARGAVIESLDILANALDRGRLAAVGLDTFSPEPPDIAHRLFTHPRCLCAPHAMAVSHLAMERIYRTMATGMVDVLEGRRPEFCVNPEVLGL